MFLAQGDSKAFCKAFKKKKHGQCPVSKQEQLAHFQNLVGSQLETGDVPVETQANPGEVPQPDYDDSEPSCLNGEFTAEELQKCIQSLKRGKASGVDGIMAEMLIDGGEALHQCLLTMYDRMLEGAFPAGLSVGLITAVFTSGDVNDMGNYRGITVTPVLAKLFAMLLKARITEYTDGHHLRGQGQAGFRPDYRTIDNVFVMQQLIERYAKNADKKDRKIFACFVDFRKAFDTVDRCVLWQVLWNIGIRGRILPCIKAMYECDSAAVITKEGVTEIFGCYLGVKQGCPLSPDLFGIFIDELERVMLTLPNSAAPLLPHKIMHQGIQCCRKLCLLLYADDLVLLSASREGLQNQLSTLHSFCSDRRLTVNVAKTKMMLFEKRRTDCCAVKTL